MLNYVLSVDSNNSNTCTSSFSQKLRVGKVLMKNCRVFVSAKFIGSISNGESTRLCRFLTSRFTGSIPIRAHHHRIIKPVMHCGINVRTVHTSSRSLLLITINVPSIVHFL